MQQGDQFKLRVAIHNGETPIAPENCAGVKIAISDIEHSYPGTLTYDSVSESWLFPVTQEQTLAMKGYVSAQVQVNFGGNPAEIIGSGVCRIPVEESIIMGTWDD